MESDAVPRSVVRDIVGSFGLFVGDHGANVEHATVTVDSPIPQMPRPPAGASPQRPQPAQPNAAPDTLDGYAAAFSLQMAGPQMALPAPAQPARAAASPTTALTMPQASAPPLMPNTNDTSPQ